MVEVRLEAAERRFEEHLRGEERTLEAQQRVNESQLRLIEKLDQRMDHQDVLFARLLGAVAVMVTAIQFLGPVVLRAIGL